MAPEQRVSTPALSPEAVPPPERPGPERRSAPPEPHVVGEGAPDRVKVRLEAGSLPLGSAPLPSNGVAEERPAGDAPGAIAAEIVGLLRKHIGRRPTTARATVSSDLVVITLADCLTTAEMQLRGTGSGELVGHTRGVLHRGMGAETTSIVEQLTGRQVTTYLTAQHHDPDLTVLVFFLAPSDSGPRSDSDAVTF